MVMSYAVKNYMKRFSIELAFKNQKTNSHFLEETQIKDLYAFGNLYACLCFSQSLLTILGINYSRNLNCYKKLINYQLLTLTYLSVFILRFITCNKYHIFE